jgi:glycosyltransferase involved in cell wall biosynthesis
MKKKILFIQHAAGFGGSAMSLLYTLQEIQKQAGQQYTLIVALAKWTQNLADFYETAGFEVVKPDVIDTYEHTQAVSFNLWNPIHVISEIKQLLRIKKAIINTQKLIEKVKPDLVHLNSVVLIGSALAVQRQNIALIWHVREHPVKGLIGLRYNFIKKLLKTLPNKVIFICNADKAAWGNPVNGSLVYNFVDFKNFEAKQQKAKNINGIEIPNGDLNILFLGAVAKIKGGLYLIKAINKLMAKYPEKNIYLLYPGSIYTPPQYLLYRIAKGVLPLIGQGTYSQLVEREINKSPNADNFIKLPFTKDVAKMLSASDVLVFPSIRPHFARPIIEAGAMMKPVIGSKLDGVKELIADGLSGFFVRPKNVKDITDKLEILLIQKDKRLEMGHYGYAVALEKFEAKKNILQIIEIYNRII